MQSHFTLFVSFTIVTAVACDDTSFGGGDSGDVVDRDGGHPVYDYSGMAPKSEGDPCEHIYDPCASLDLECGFDPMGVAVCLPDAAPQLNGDWGEPCGILSEIGLHECMDGLHCEVQDPDKSPLRTCQPMCWGQSDCPEDYRCQQWSQDHLGWCTERV
ncbi:MAG: hypothetical protein H6713_40600 [Myxococcales bacterium]|nr:hypothetical protein [Myxococcales bacterium]